MRFYSFPIIHNKNKTKKFPQTLFETVIKKTGYEIQQGFMVNYLTDCSFF